jgi:hypothetical protein
MMAFIPDRFWGNFSNDLAIVMEHHCMQRYLEKKALFALRIVLDNECFLTHLIKY